MSRFVEKSSNLRHGAVDTVKHHPVSAVLIGMGLGWFIVDNLMARSKGEVEPQSFDEGLAEASVEELTMADTGEHHREYRERMNRAAHAVREKAVQVEKRAEETAEHMREKAHHLRERAVHGVHSAQSGFSKFTEERPLTIGLTGVAIGTVIGLVAAGAFRQDGSMGPARRERIRHRAGEFVHEAKERAGRVVHRPHREARDAGRTEETAAH